MLKGLKENVHKYLTNPNKRENIDSENSAKFIFFHFNPKSPLVKGKVKTVGFSHKTSNVHNRGTCFYYDTATTVSTIRYPLVDSSRKITSRILKFVTGLWIRIRLDPYAFELLELDPSVKNLHFKTEKESMQTPF